MNKDKNILERYFSNCSLPVYDCVVYSKATKGEIKEYTFRYSMYDLQEKK